jgi:hypothetical protein
METVVYDSFNSLPAEEELKARNRTWRAVAHLQDLCKQQEAQGGAAAAAETAAAAAGGSGAGAGGGDAPASPAGGADAGAAAKGGQDVPQMQVPVLTMADLQASDGHVLPLPLLSSQMAMLQSGQGLASIPHAALQHLVGVR